MICAIRCIASLKLALCCPVLDYSGRVVWRSGTQINVTLIEVDLGIVPFSSLLDFSEPRVDRVESKC